MVYVSNNDGDFAGVVGDLGVRVKYILDHNEVKAMFNIKRFMLDMHPDIIRKVKGLWSNYRPRGAVDLQRMVTWKAVTEGMRATYFVDNNFNCIGGNG